MALSLTGITWILTYNCNLACEHCFFDTKQKKAVLDPALVKNALNGLDPQNAITWQHISGGEPLLHSDELKETIGAIRTFGTQQIGIATNGFWAGTAQQALATLSPLKDAGLTGVCLSVDTYHQKFLSLDRLKHAVDAVDALSLNGHSWVVNCQHKDTDPDLDAFLQDCKLPVGSVPVRNIGYGGQCNESNASLPEGPCRDLCCCMGDTSPFDPKMVWIDPYGNVMICYGIVIGNLRNTSLAEIIDGYAPGNHELLTILAEQGPIGLYHRIPGDTKRQAFDDECDLCYYSRQQLKDAYPELLAPEECYPMG